MNKHCIALMLIFAGAGLADSVFAQQVQDLPLQTVAKQCVTAQDGTRVCKPPVTVQRDDEDGAESPDVTGGCVLEDGGWVCDSPLR